MPDPQLLPAPRVLFLGEVDYSVSLARMQALTAARDSQTRDEIWVLRHPPVFTQGTSCDAKPRTAAGIPVIKTDRGGQITYHGPGQLIFYLLLDIKRLGIGPKKLVHRIESAMIHFLASEAIDAERREGAPGIYVANQKIAALGLRIKNGRCYHGLSFNVSMDLRPFDAIDPCGYAGLEVTQLSAFGVDKPMLEIENQLVDSLIASIYSLTDGAHCA